VSISAAQPVQVSGPVNGPPPSGGDAPSDEPAAPQPQSVSLPAPTAAEPEPEPTQGPRLVANFEDGLNGWTAAAGDRLPRLSRAIVRDGTNASVVRLTDGEGSSRLILGGSGGIGDGEDALQIQEGDQYAFAFSFYITQMAYGGVGTDNQIMRLVGEGSDTHSLGLQLWEYASSPWYEGTRGLWSSGEATAGPRLLAATEEGVWHDVILHFRASTHGDGFYEIYVDGQLVDARDGVTLIPPGSAFAQIEVGLFRDADQVHGTSEIRIDAAKLGDTLNSVLP
jgi:hypothetical protein